MDSQLWTTGHASVQTAGEQVGQNRESDIRRQSV